jgi:hypothetical protein
MGENIVYVPLTQDEHAAVKITLDDLPRDKTGFQELKAVLMGEVASLDIWLVIAALYLRQGHIDHFQDLCMTINDQRNKQEIEQFYGSEAHGRVRMANAEASYRIRI